MMKAKTPDAEIELVHYAMERALKSEAWNQAHREYIATIEGKLCDAIRENVALELRVKELEQKEEAK